MNALTTLAKRARALWRAPVDAPAAAVVDRPCGLTSRDAFSTTGASRATGVPTAVGAWAWYDAQATAQPALPRVRAAIEGLVPHDMFISPLLDRELFAALLTRAVWRRGVNGAQALRTHLNAIKGSPAEVLVAVLRWLGPGFEKLGQFLGNRPDLVAAHYRPAMALLSDRGTPMSLHAFERAVIAQLEQQRPPGADAKLSGRQLLARVFATIDSEPLGTGSIGQARAATLLDGTPLVIKVVKEGAAQALTADFAVISEVLDAAGAQALARLVRELERQSLPETDLRHEARAMADGRDHLLPLGIEVPRVFAELSGAGVLVMERVAGNNAGRVELPAEQRPQAARDVFDAIVGMIIRGKFHGDPHRGNVMLHVPTLGAAKVGLVDWGLTSSIGFRDRLLLAHLVHGLHKNSITSLRLTMRWLGIRDADGRFAEIAGRHVQSTGPILTRIEALLFELQLAGAPLSGALVGAAKSLLLADGVAREIDPAFAPELSLATYRLLPSFTRDRSKPVKRVAQALRTVDQAALDQKIETALTKLRRDAEAVLATDVPVEPARSLAYDALSRRLQNTHDSAVGTSSAVLELLDWVRERGGPAQIEREQELRATGAWAVARHARARALHAIAGDMHLYVGALTDVIAEPITRAALACAGARLSPEQARTAGLPGASSVLLLQIEQRATAARPVANPSPGLVTELERLAVSTGAWDSVAARRQRILSALRPLFFVLKDRTDHFAERVQRADAAARIAPAHGADVGPARRALRHAAELELDVLRVLAPLAKEANWWGIDIAKRREELAQDAGWRLPTFASGDPTAGAVLAESQRALLAVVHRAQELLP